MPATSWARGREIAGVSVGVIVPSAVGVTVVGKAVSAVPAPLRLLGMMGFLIVFLGVLLQKIWMDRRGVRLYGQRWGDLFQELRRQPFAPGYRSYLIVGFLVGFLPLFAWGLAHAHDRLWFVNVAEGLLPGLLGAMVGVGLVWLFHPVWRPGAIIGCLEGLVSAAVMGWVAGLPQPTWDGCVVVMGVLGSTFGASAVPIVQLLWEHRDPLTGESLG